MNFVYYQGNLYFHCAPKGEKLDNLARDPRVCFEVDLPLAYLDTGFDPERRIRCIHQFYHCVIIRGEARVIPNGPLKLAALNALVASHENSPGHELVNEDMPAYKACKVAEIRPASISAKSDLHQAKSPEERRAIARYLTTRNRPGDLKTARAMGCEGNWRRYLCRHQWPHIYRIYGESWHLCQISGGPGRGWRSRSRRRRTRRLFLY